MLYSSDVLELVIEGTNAGLAVEIWRKPLDPPRIQRLVDVGTNPVAPCVGIAYEAVLHVRREADLGW